MKVKELIEKLKTYDPELLVLVSGYEGGLESRILISKQSVQEKVIPYSGNYEVWTDYDKRTLPRKRSKKALTIERNP